MAFLCTRVHSNFVYPRKNLTINLSLFPAFDLICLISFVYIKIERGRGKKLDLPQIEFPLFLCVFPSYLRAFSSQSNVAHS